MIFVKKSSKPNKKHNYHHKTISKVLIKYVVFITSSFSRPSLWYSELVYGSIQYSVPGEEWRNVGPKIHSPQIHYQSFALEKALGLARLPSRLWDFGRPGEIVYELQEVQTLTLQSPEFEAVSFRTNITSHSSPGTLIQYLSWFITYLHNFRTRASPGET